MCNDYINIKHLVLYIYIQINMLNQKKESTYFEYLTQVDYPYVVGKMFKNISPDLVRSGRTCPVLSGQEIHMPSPVEPYFVGLITSTENVQKKI